MHFKSICYIYCTTAVHFAFKFAVRDEISKDLVLKAVLHRSPEHPPSSVLGFDASLLNSNWAEGEGKGKKGMRAGGTDNQGLQICWNMDYSSLKVEAGVNLNFCQDGRNNYCSSLYSQR